MRISCSSFISTLTQTPMPVYSLMKTVLPNLNNSTHIICPSYALLGRRVYVGASLIPIFNTQILISWYTGALPVLCPTDAQRYSVHPSWLCGVWSRSDDHISLSYYSRPIWMFQPTSVIRYIVIRLRSTVCFCNPAACHLCFTLYKLNAPINLFRESALLNHASLFSELQPRFVDN